MEFFTNLMVYFGFSQPEQQVSFELVHFHLVPINDHFYLDAKGKPGMAVAKKVSPTGGIMGNQYVNAENKQVWVSLLCSTLS